VLILKRRIAYCGVIGLLILGTAAGTALSQDEPSGFSEAWKTWAATQDPRDLVEAYRVWKLTEALDLSEEQMPLFFSKIRQIDKLDAEHRKEEIRALREIGRLLETGDASDADLDRALREYEDLRRRHLEEVRTVRQEAAQLLSIRQRCQYVVFEERFKTHLRDMIGRVREIRGQRGLEGGGEMMRPDDPGRSGGVGRGGSQRSGGGSGTGRGRR
jgi:hypothetical protein